MFLLLFPLISVIAHSHQTLKELAYQTRLSNVTFQITYEKTNGRVGHLHTTSRKGLKMFILFDCILLSLIPV